MTVNRFSQSKKWREVLGADLRVPMVDVDGEHFYVYEPAQLQDSTLVVPVYFYRDCSGLRAKCLPAGRASPLSQSLLIAEEPDFNSRALLDIGVHVLAAAYPCIHLANGLKWASCPEAKLLRTYKSQSSHIVLGLCTETNVWSVLFRTEWSHGESR